MAKSGVTSDRYYGTKASGYEQSRVRTSQWQNEQKTVTEWVTSGTVLDAPVGTGRFIPHYLDCGIDYTGFDISGDMIAQARRKDPSGHFVQGSLTDRLPFDDDQFDHVVCMRFLVWLYPSDMERALREILRVGKSVTFSVRLGVEGPHQGKASLTHDRDRILAITGDPLRAVEVERSPAGAHEVWQV